MRENLNRILFAIIPAATLFIPGAAKAYDWNVHVAFDVPNQTRYSAYYNCDGYCGTAQIYATFDTYDSPGHGSGCYGGTYNPPTLNYTVGTTITYNCNYGPTLTASKAYIKDACGTVIQAGPVSTSWTAVSETLITGAPAVRVVHTPNATCHTDYAFFQAATWGS